ncbi:MAG: nitrile hydratase subunit alpha [Dehalococcoidia bacterium]
MQMSEPSFDYYAARKAGTAGHGHDHGDHLDAHAPPGDDDNGPPGDSEIVSRAIQELLEHKGLVKADDVRRQMELFDEEFPYRGSQVVARAWTDPDFMQALLEDGKAACADMGVEVVTERLIAVPNTPEVHNAIVCTLCSCYPRSLLGMPPTWYKSQNYRSRMVYEPRSVLREFGTVIPDHVAVRVHDSTADMRYVVVPMQPDGTEDWTVEQLEAILTRDTLVGVTVPKVSVDE